MTRVEGVSKHYNSKHSENQFPLFNLLNGCLDMPLVPNTQRHSYCRLERDQKKVHLSMVKVSLELLPMKNFFFLRILCGAV